MSPRVGIVVAALGILASGCTPPPPTPSPVEADRYASPSAWLCLPGRGDACTGDLTATALRPDGSRVVEPFVPAKDPKVDCFYVYPTVDLSLVPRNHDDFSSVDPMARTALAQAARFRETCALYAPLYRQVTIGTYLQRKEWRERALAVAFADVEASFAYYLRHYNRGRPIVLVGHSQGAEMVTRLVRRFFDDDPAMRSKLLLAMPIGGDVEAPTGQTAGGSFAHVPACTGALQTGCVIAYRSYDRNQTVEGGRSQPDPGEETVCVNPADVEKNTLRPLAAAYLPSDGKARAFMKGLDGVETPFVVYRDFYAAQCATNGEGFRYLAVSLLNAPGDVRTNPFDFASMPLRRVLGLHILDFQLPQGDLVELVKKRVRTLPQ